MTSLKTFQKLTDEAITEITAKDEMSKKVWDSFKSFRDSNKAWSAVSEEAYYNKLS